MKTLLAVLVLLVAPTVALAGDIPIPPAPQPTSSTILILLSTILIP